MRNFSRYFKFHQVSMRKKTCGANIYIYLILYMIIYGHEHDGGDCMIISCDIPMEVLVDKRMLNMFQLCVCSCMYIHITYIYMCVCVCQLEQIMKINAMILTEYAGKSVEQFSSDITMENIGKSLCLIWPIKNASTLAMATSGAKNTVPSLVPTGAASSTSSYISGSVLAQCCTLW